MSGILKFISQKCFCRLGKARPGMGLPMALIIVLVGGALVAFMFQASAQFTVLSTRQQVTYLDHVRAADYVEMVKGMISTRNAQLTATSLPALHCLRISDDLKIRNADDLQIHTVFTNNDVSIDRTIPRTGQRVSVRVYDASYYNVDLEDTFLSGDKEGEPPKSAASLTTAQRLMLADMPPPVLLTSTAGSSGGSGSTMSDETYLDDGREITRHERDTPPPPPSRANWGTYVVRVELFDSHGKQVRFLEEAFFQIISRDL